MTRYELAARAVLCATLLLSCVSRAQTPDQQKAWDEERARKTAAEQVDTERLARDRAARKADPMGWVRTLDPMTSGGWEFRSVANDGSWATFSSTHQMKRSGNVATVWMRQEYAEPQSGGSGRYMSVVEKAQFDCKKEQTRDLLVVYYTANNLQGSQESEEGDTKETPWNPIVPGTRQEQSFTWACAHAR